MWPERPAWPELLAPFSSFSHLDLEYLRQDITPVIMDLLSGIYCASFNSLDCSAPDGVAIVELEDAYMREVDHAIESEDHLADHMAIARTATPGAGGRRVSEVLAPPPSAHQ